MFGLNAVAGSGGAAVAAQTASIHTAGAPQFKELPYLPRYDTNVIIYRYYLRRRPCEPWCCGVHGKRWTSTIGDNDVQLLMSITLI